MESVGYLWCVLVLFVSREYAVCQAAEDFCSYQSTGMMKSVSLETPAGQWSDDACRCVVTPNFNSTQSPYRLMTVEIEFSYHAVQDANLPPCLPMLMVDPTQTNSFFSNNPISAQFYACPAVDGTFHHTSTHQVYKGQELAFHMSNPNKDMVNAKVTVLEFAGTLDVSCDTYERIMYEEDKCPCSSAEPGTGVWRDRTQEEFDEKRRLLIGLVTAFVFAAIIIAIIVGAVFFKRRQAKKAALASGEAVTVENKAYEGSKQSVASDNKSPIKDATISYTPDPNLNLKLQHGGSKDSGLASSNDNERGRLPFMQPPPASRSMDDVNNPQPDNYPSLAGQGSMSSLDNTVAPVEPVYTTRMPKHQSRPSAATPSGGLNQNYPPLAGQGSQSSLNRLPQYGNIDDVVYAKLAKKPPHAPGRARSHDNLAAGVPEHHQSEASLNTSRVTIETDI